MEIKLNLSRILSIILFNNNIVCFYIISEL